MKNSGETLILQALGAEFLAYITATTPEIIRRRLTQGDEQLSEEREAVLANLLRFVQNVTSSPDHAGWLNHSLADAIGRVPEGESIAITSLLRRDSGGVVWQPSDDLDTITRELLVMLRDVYPIMLLPEDPLTPFQHGVSLLAGPLYRHPQRESFNQAVMDDESLKQLFPEVRDGQGPVGVVYSSADRGGSTQLSMLAGQLIGAGWEWARLSSRTPTIEEHAAGVRRALTTLVAAINKRPATVPARVGITGVLLPDGCEEIDLGWARLRPADERDENSLIDTALAGSSQVNNPDGSTVEIKYRGDIVLEMEIDYRIRLKEVDIIKDGWPRDLDPSTTIETRLESLRLGLLLAFPDQQSPMLVVPTWRLTIDPSQTHIIAGWNDPRNTLNLLPRQLSDDDVIKWKEWAILIGEKRQNSISVAIRRALLAASQRPIPEDKLVDAVVVWENLFGSKQETAMRVTMSLAWLLADSVAERKELRSTISKLYTLRSDIVHGSKQLTREEVSTKPDEAMKVALDALRAIFRERPDLIDEVDGAARSNRILLGD